MKRAIVLSVLVFAHTILAFGQTYSINFSGDSPRNSVIITIDAAGKAAVSARGGSVNGVKTVTNGNTTTTSDSNGRWEIIITEGDAATTAQSNSSREQPAAKRNTAVKASSDGSETVVTGQGYTISINRYVED